MNEMRHLTISGQKTQNKVGKMLHRTTNPSGALRKTLYHVKMAANFLHLSKRLKLMSRPYRTSCEHIGKHDYMDASDFHKLNIAETCWIDWNNSTRGNCGITINPDYGLNVFLELCEDKDRDLCQEMVRLLWSQYHSSIDNAGN